MNKGKYWSTEISDCFALRGIGEGKPITQMLVQKMVYFAHGLYLAETKGSPLIKEDFEAWKFGPVVPNIYHKYKIFGDTPIRDLSLLRYSGHSVEPCELINVAYGIIEDTWKNLKDLDAIQVSNWTHKDGSAWSRVYNPNERNIIIPNEYIMDDFKEFIVEE